MSTTQSTMPTIGTRIDSVIAKIGSLPLTYQAFVIVCCLFAFIVLNTNPTNPVFTSNDAQYRLDKLAATTDLKKKPTASSSSSKPQPKWHILKMLNIVSVIGLLTSFCWFASNASNYLNDSEALLKFMVVWGLFLCYFFGFFGISFVDAEELEKHRSVGNGGRSAG